MPNDGSIRAAIVEFLRRTALADASRVEQLPFGFAALVPELPKAYDLNLVWVDDPGRVDASELVAVGERLAAEHGYEHAELLVPDDPGAALLGPALAAAGYLEEPRVLMVARRSPDRPAAHRAEKIDLAAMMAFTEATLRESPDSFDEDTIRQLCDAKQVVARSGGRFLGARTEDGTLASVCDLYSDGTTAQIEAVITLQAHRGRGFARSLVLHAVDEARRGGHALVFLQADGHDWPQHLYGKLGFDPVGVVTRYLRAPSGPGVPG